MTRIETTIGILECLVGFDTVSSRSNLALVDWVGEYLHAYGIESSLGHDETGEKANLLAIIGPRDDGGAALCGHTDVVPAEPEQWSTDPFRLVRSDGRLQGRGSADMKGFIACALTLVPDLVAGDLRRPIHLALTFDEEVGCCGAPILVEQIRAAPCRPRVAIVGEPTAMRLVTGHKGGHEMTTTITGLDAHASDPRRGVNAIDYAARLVAHLEETALALAVRADAHSAFDPPYTTINVGTIRGGTARNVIARSCTIEWELRPLPNDDPDAILRGIDDWVRAELVPAMRAHHPEADVVTEVEASLPGLSWHEGSEAADLVQRLWGSNTSEVAAFGTDAGHLQRGGISSVVFGPGSIEQAHRPDEFIEIDQLEACLRFLDRLHGWASSEA